MNRWGFCSGGRQKLTINGVVPSAQNPEAYEVPRESREPRAGAPRATLTFVFSSVVS